MNNEATSAPIERIAQKKNGNPGEILARLLPIGGEKAPPSMAIVKTSPNAVPEWAEPIPSVSSSIVVVSAIKVSIETPTSKTSAQTAAPLASGSKNRDAAAANNAGISMAFLEPSRSDSEDKGMTNMVLTA